MSKSELIKSGLADCARALKRFADDEGNIRTIGRAADMMIAAFAAGNRVFSCGNGGSMCDAMHFAEELSGRFRKNRRPLAAVAISDPSHLTCVGNDFGFDQVFSSFIAAHGRKGDVLLAISTSGKSPNVIKAAEQARVTGMRVVSLVGKPDTKLQGISDLAIVALGGEFSDRSQELHIKVIHLLIELVEREIFPENYS